MTKVMEFIQRFGGKLFQLTWEVLPFFLGGVLFAAVLERYFKSEWFNRFLKGKGLGTMFAVSALAAVLPGCACTTVPMTEGFKRKGASIGVLTAFLMMSPLLAPQTILLTYGMLGWKMTAARVLMPFLFIPALGLLLEWWNQRWPLADPPAKRFISIGIAPAGKGEIPVANFGQALWAVMKSLAPYFALGMAIAALFVTVVPEGALASYINPNGVWAYLTAALVGIPIYICEGEEIPLTYALMQGGLGAGPSFTFMLGAVGTCIPTMLMAQKIIGRKATIIYAVAWFPFVMLSGWLFSAVFS